MITFFTGTIVLVVAATFFILEVSVAKGVLRDLPHSTTERSSKITYLDDVLNRVTILKKANVDLVDIMGIVKQDNVELRRLVEDLPFTCAGDQCTADSKYLVFPKGAIVGKSSGSCAYVDVVLSVDGAGLNCASGDSSITFGQDNKATGVYFVVAGGYKNTASGNGLLSVVGGTTRLPEYFLLILLVILTQH